MRSRILMGMKWMMLVMMVGLAAPVWALTDAEAVNMSGLQRMLSQRIAKSYLMLGQQISVQDARQQREASVAQFDRNLATLKDYAPTPDIRAGLASVEQVWTGYRKRVLATPAREEALTVIRQSDEVLAQSEKVVKLIQDYSKVSSARLVNISGRQRMLSQRIGKLYLLKSWGLSYPELDNHLAEAISNYDATLIELSGSPQNTAEIRDGLAKVKSIWKFSKAGFALSSDNLYVPTAICNTTENLLKHMQAITKLYEQQMQLADNNKNPQQKS